MIDGVPFGPSPEYVEALQRIATADTELSAKRGLPFRWDDEIETLPPIQWLATGLVPANCLAAIYGAPGAGKSFVALDLAFSVCNGLPWLGRTVTQGAALYMAAEGLSGLPARMREWKHARGRVGIRQGVAVVTSPIDLLKPADAMRVVDTAEAIGKPVALVIIDTLARSMIGDENNTGDMSRVIAHADAIRAATGATVLLVHHTRKDSDLERGSSALRGAVDTLLQCREGEDGRELVCEKQKDAEQFAPIPFRLVAGHGSCIVQASVGEDPSSAREQAGAMTPKRHAVLKTLLDAFTDRGATASEWMKASRVSERTYYHVRTWLCRNGYVVERGTRYTLTLDGRSAANRSLGPTATTANAPQSPLQSGISSPLKGDERLQRGAAANGSFAVALQNGKPDEGYYADLLAEVDERFGMGEDE